MKRILIAALVAVTVAGAVFVGAFFLLLSPSEESEAGCPEFSPASVEVGDPGSLEQASDDYERFATQVADPELAQHLTTLATFFFELSEAASGSGPVTVSLDEASEATDFVEKYLASCGSDGG